MTIENITISGISVWLSVDQLREYSSDISRIETRQEFLCYYKLSEPTAMIIGELFKDDSNKPILFNSVDTALAFAINELERRLK